MAIKIKSLETAELTKESLNDGYLYKDLTLDLTPSYSYNNKLNKKDFLKDVQASYDAEAIKNSITNIFLTSPGDKLLNPTFGIDLKRFLFEPVDDFISEIIRDDIETKLPLMEPRVVVDEVKVDPDEDENQYNISLRIDVPTLSLYGLTIKSRLNSTGYTIL
jgi:phage baseplate assembly protein W